MNEFKYTSVVLKQFKAYYLENRLSLNKIIRSVLKTKWKNASVKVF